MPERQYQALMNPFWSPTVQEGVKPLTPGGDVSHATGIVRGVMEQNGEVGVPW